MAKKTTSSKLKAHVKKGKKLKEFKPTKEVKPQAAKKEITAVVKNAPSSIKEVVVKPLSAKAKLSEIKKGTPVLVKTQKVSKKVADVTKPLTRPDGYIFTVTLEDVDAEGKRHFLKGLPGDVIAQLDFTFQRIDKAMYLIDCIMPNGSKQAMQRPMGSIANADKLFAELVEMENNRGENETTQQHSPKEVVLVNSVDVDKLIKNLPAGPKATVKTNDLKNPVIVPEGTRHAPPKNNRPFIVPGANDAAVSAPKVETNPAVEMHLYAKTIEETLFDSFSMKMHNTINKKEFDRVMDGLIKYYKYQVVTANEGSYINISFNEQTVRVPQDVKKFITII